MACIQPRLQHLPREILLDIVEYLRRPSDLRNLYLVSKCLNPIATAALHYKIELDVHNLGSSATAAFLLARNRGHAHVKQLNFKPLEGDISDPKGVLALMKKANRTS